MIRHGRDFLQCNPFDNYGYMGHPYGWLMMLFFIAVAVAIVIFIRRNGKENKKNRAIESLDLRYARDEIDEETYLRMKRTLREK